MQERGRQTASCSLAFLYITLLLQNNLVFYLPKPSHGILLCIHFHLLHARNRVAHYASHVFLVFLSHPPFKVYNQVLKCQPLSSNLRVPKCHFVVHVFSAFIFSVWSHSPIIQVLASPNTLFIPWPMLQWIMVLHVQDQIFIKTKWCLCIIPHIIPVIYLTPQFTLNSNRKYFHGSTETKIPNHHSQVKLGW